MARPNGAELPLHPLFFGHLLFDGARVAVTAGGGAFAGPELFSGVTGGAGTGRRTAACAPLLAFPVTGSRVTARALGRGTIPGPGLALAVTRLGGTVRVSPVRGTLATLLRTIGISPVRGTLATLLRTIGVATIRGTLAIPGPGLALTITLRTLSTRGIGAIGRTVRVALRSPLAILRPRLALTITRRRGTVRVAPVGGAVAALLRTVGVSAVSRAVAILRPRLALTGLGGTVGVATVRRTLAITLRTIGVSAVSRTLPILRPRLAFTVARLRGPVGVAAIRRTLAITLWTVGVPAISRTLTITRLGGTV
ncbi:hypothetical protein E3T33_03960 [Cryobacterium sp. TMT1-2-1]|uniref:hypothetical protein n=1 Tax=Cryobacterium sp. TMT1-2-1 TaxID=1259232 RepID=UPI0010695AA5|nr:hypothetical protein [Cryobacterium sp. TMT1-2-1]TFD47185.1 hypothetical protein E3T33_03960 [Cryobacterium sp. TMT1-2-1]